MRKRSKEVISLRQANERGMKFAVWLRLRKKGLSNGARKRWVDTKY